MTSQHEIDTSILARLTQPERAENPKNLFTWLPFFDIFRARGDYRGALAHLLDAESLVNDKGDPL